MDEEKIRYILQKATHGSEKSFEKFVELAHISLNRNLIQLTGTSNDAEEIFLDSIEVFWEKFIHRKDGLPVNVMGYLMTMCKNAWYIKSRREKAFMKVDIDQVDANSMPAESSQPFEDNLEIEEMAKEQALKESMSELSEKCKALMEASFSKEVKLKDIQLTLGYENYQAMIQAKYNCKRKLTKLVYAAFQKIIIETKSH